jgi:hypothetical protein
MTHKFKELISQENVTQYERWFGAIANELLNKTYLKIKNDVYEIIEAEFYVNEPNHPDLFSHSTEDQKQNGMFCFHKHGPSFKEGSYTGLDIAIGNEQRYGGILIRGIRELNSKKIIDGPSNVVSEILKQFGEGKVRDLAKKLDFSIDGNDIKLVATNSRDKELFRSPRVGLTLKRAAKEKVEFLLKEYRYIKYPELTKKGRYWIIASALINGKPLPLSQHISAKFLELLNSGRDKKINLHHFDHHSSRDDLIELYGAIKFQETIRTKIAS